MPPKFDPNEVKKGIFHLILFVYVLYVFKVSRVLSAHFHNFQCTWGVSEVK